MQVVITQDHSKRCAGCDVLNNLDEFVADGFDRNGLVYDVAEKYHLLNFRVVIEKARDASGKIIVLREGNEISAMAMSPGITHMKVRYRKRSGFLDPDGAMGIYRDTRSDFVTIKDLHGVRSTKG